MSQKSDLEEGLMTQLKQVGLPLPERQYKAVEGRQWTWDFAWLAERLLLEVDGGGFVGGRHSRGMGIENDSEKQSTAAAFGWRTMRVTGKLIARGRAIELLETALLGCPLPSHRPLVRIEPKRGVAAS